MRCCLNVVFISVLALFPVSALSQSPPTSMRPKLGLVLEGGGALGLAHIGVLQWLEEHRVPVSYVAGTSMGGLVGGIYATGHSALEVKALVNSIDWGQMLQGQVPYEDLSFRRKQDAFDYPNRLEFGLRRGLQFPEGFNSGQQVVMTLDRVALPYSEVHDFNDLPTPFACVATDLVTSHKFVFRQGSLSIALRSTMSLPGIFTPVRWEGHVFADGGMLDNLPVDVALSMGADLTLAVHLQTARLEPESTLSSFGVLSRSVSVVIAANELRSMEKADMLISVPLENYDSLDYDRSEEIIRLGYQAAESKAALLNTLSVDEATWKKFLALRAARRRTTPIPKFVQVTGTSPILAKAIENDLKNHIGKPVKPIAVQNQLLDIMGEGRFSNLSYQIVDRNGAPGLAITGVEKPYSPSIVRPLIQLDGSNFNGVYFSMGARITFLDFGAHRAELRNDLVFGSRYVVASQYYRPLSPTSKWYIAPNAFGNYQRYPIYRANNLLAEYRKTSTGGGIELGHEFGRIAQIALGYTAAYQKFIPTIGDQTLLPNVSGRFGATALRFSLNDVDDPVIPHAGQYANINGSWVDSNLGAARGYPLAEGRIVKFLKMNESGSVYFGAAGATTFGKQPTALPSFSLSETNTFAAYGENELLTNQYYLLRAGYLREVARLPVLLGEGIYFSGMFEVGKVFAAPFLSQVPGDVAAGLVINTIFGPVSFGGAVGAAGHQRVFLKLGRVF